MPIEVELPDGNVVEFPDGTSPQTMEAALASYKAPDASPKPMPARRTQPNKAYALANAMGVGNQLGVLDGLQHHVMNLPHGLSQLVEHGVNAGANLLPEDNSFRQSVNRTVASDDAAMRQREADYQARTDGNAGSYLGATVGEIAPWMLGIGALRSAGMLPKATTTAQKALALAGEGAAMGAVQPVTGEGSYSAQKALQTGVGAITGPALLGAGKAAGGLLDAGRYMFNPESIANQKVAGVLGGTDPAQSIGILRNAPQHVPGEVPTAASVLATPEAVQAERVLRNSPTGGPIFAARDNANNAARLQVAQGLGGDEAALLAAKQARTDATQPFRLANLPEVGSVPVDTAGLLATLKKLTMSPNATVRAAAKEHQQVLRANGADKGPVPALVLDDLRQEVGSMLAKHAPMGVVGSKEAAKYGPVSTEITDALERAIPGYRAYLADYAQKSEPINTMESVNRLFDPNSPGGLNTAGDPLLAVTRLKQVLRGDDKARYPMADSARAQLEGVRESLHRRSIVDNKIAASGPGTAADLNAGLLSGDFGGMAKRGAGALAGGLLGHLTGLPVGEVGGAVMGGLLGDAVGAVNNRVAKKVATKASSAELAAAALEADQRRRNRTRALGLLSPYLLPYQP